MSSTGSTSPLSKTTVNSQILPSFSEPKSELPIHSAVSCIEQMGRKNEEDTPPILRGEVTVQKKSDPSSTAGQTNTIPPISSSSTHAHSTAAILNPTIPSGLIPLSIESNDKIKNPPRVLDPGLKAALDFFKRGNDNLCKQQDFYAQLLDKSIFLDSEEQAIRTIQSWDPETQQFFLKAHVNCATNNESYILLDVFRLAALQGRFSLLSYLLNKMNEHHLKLDLAHSEDRFGWNLAHFVALHSCGTFPLSEISEITALCQRPNKAGATPLNFVEWLSEPEHIAVQALGKSLPPLNEKQFSKLTKSKYWVRPRFTPGALLRLCFEVPKIDAPKYLSTLLPKKINDFVENIKNLPSKIKINKMSGPNIPKVLEGGWECLSSQDISKGEVIALYTGIVIHEIWRGPTFPHGKAFRVCENMFVDADIGGGSLAQFINHGFPNCTFFPFIFKGLPVTAIIALEAIKTDSPLYLYYGSRYFKGMNITHVVLNKESIDRYLTATKDLRKIPFLEFRANGLEYWSADGGQRMNNKLTAPASESDAIDAWANKIKLEYLANYYSDGLKQKLDRPVYKWLVTEFQKK